MSNIQLLVDVDLTVVDVSQDWWEWMQRQYLHKIPRTSKHNDYNLSTYFKESCNKPFNEVIEPFNFYNGYNEPYTGKEPIKGSREALWRLSASGFDIIFVSYVIGDHLDNKHEWLKLNFPFLKGFVATEDKHLVKGDILIDDRNNMLNKCNLPIKIKYDTIYTQEEDLAVNNPDGSDLDFLISSDWQEIAEYLLTMKRVIK